METLGVDFDLFDVSGISANPLESKIPLQRSWRVLSILGELEKYDLLHAQFSFPTSFLLAFLRRSHRKPLIVHTHGYDVLSVSSLDYGLRRNFLGDLAAVYAWKNAFLVISVCGKCKEEIVNTGLPSDKIAVLYNGVNTEIFRRRQVEVPELIRLRESSDFIVLSVGSLTPVKNHKGLISAYRKFLLEHKVGRKSKLLICGEGPERRFLTTYARQLGVSENVVFLGHQPRRSLPDILNISDLFVLPSFSEAHPWSLLEAMSCELPVVATDVGGIPETVPDQRCLIPRLSLFTKDSNEIFLRLALLADDPAYRRRIGVENREAVLKRFTVQEHTQRLLDLYKLVLGEES